MTTPDHSTDRPAPADLAADYEDVLTCLRELLAALHQVNAGHDPGCPCGLCHGTRGSEYFLLLLWNELAGRAPPGVVDGIPPLLQDEAAWREAGRTPGSEDDDDDDDGP